MIRTTISLCALGMLSTVAFAQTTPPPAPIGPTMAQCEKGYVTSSQWTRAEFMAACGKMRSRN